MLALLYYVQFELITNTVVVWHMQDWYSPEVHVGAFFRRADDAVIFRPCRGFEPSGVALSSTTRPWSLPTQSHLPPAPEFRKRDFLESVVAVA